MTFISYAQNFEDVMLRRALRDVDKGFYIDAGAQDPVVDSVTKAFYDAGWRGINIEPVGEWFEKLKEDRPEDKNLKLAVGLRKGSANFYEVVGTGLSTMNPSNAKRHALEHGYEIKQYDVPVTNLTAICEEYAQPEIHFLKIDVEGAERSVLKGFDLKKFRPWIILIESTLPNSQHVNKEEWEPLISERGYHHVYFDGLNRYYIADEHNELDGAFKTPPNYFDDFKHSDKNKLECHIKWLKDELGTVRASVGHMEGHVQSLQAEMGLRDEQLRKIIENFDTSFKRGIDELHRANQQWWNIADRQSKELESARAEIYELNQSAHHWRMEADLVKKSLQNVYGSNSWRLTWPLRKLAKIISWSVRLPKRIARGCVVKAMAYFLKHAKLKAGAKFLLKHFPGFEERLRRLAQARGLVPMPAASETIPTASAVKPTESLSISPPLDSELSGAEVPVGLTVDNPSAQDLSDLPPTARRIYRKLKSAILP